MDERTIGGERQEALGEVTMLLDLAISRSRGSILLNGRAKEVVCDGNHRVSVARWLGVEALDAEVVELRAADPTGVAILAPNLLEGGWHPRPSVRPPHERWRRERRHYRHAQG